MSVVHCLVFCLGDDIMRKVTVAATQMSCSWDREAALLKAERLVRSASEQGANIILFQELFETPYFCKTQNFDYLELCSKPEDNAAIKRMCLLAKELNAVIPVSFYERVNNTAFNSVAVIDADGSILGIYRKTHIPDGLPYAEKFYFTPGDTGFKVWKTKYGNIGVGICWDQWFPEAARCMTLMGAELLFYPTAIGSEPYLKTDSKSHWQNVMRGHAAANLIPVIASNRVGTEEEDGASVTFYGSSFITDNHGCVLKEMGRSEEGFILQTFDLDLMSKERREWGVFRDRRPEMYKGLISYGN